MTNEQYHKHDETNLLIAEFMGMETVVRHPRTQEWTQARFDFHNSWNTLMPVAHKCLDIAHQEMMNEWENGFADSFLSANIDIMHKEVVNFIKWYNENKQQ